ncbi:thioredoxin [Nitrosomonas sp. Nm84]|uniref:thioredoxin TrxC n=1 Tax=Nitrosomonas sp. Nm84 TaxID=200124 RepID=UPI000D75E1CA|nr:thioredoxin TrxC [Nitrosomonas sp. Nm84]PXW83867.1 thioredoxin [Nitrosomonas sp. Nm84]
MSLHIVCPHCHATNRVPTDRLDASPQCGACHQTLFTAQPIELAESNFNRHIANNNISILVDFWAPWCGPCRMMAPAFAKAAATLEPAMRLVKVNTEEEQGLAARYNIRSIPTLVLFNGGREIARQSGAMSEHDLVRWAQTANK